MNKIYKSLLISTLLLTISPANSLTLGLCERGSIDAKQKRNCYETYRNAKRLAKIVKTAARLERCEIQNGAVIFIIIKHDLQIDLKTNLDKKYCKNNKVDIHPSECNHWIAGGIGFGAGIATCALINR